MKSINKLILAVVLFVGAGLTHAKASEIVDRHLSGFNSVSVAGSFDVFIVQGSSESVKVEAPSDVMDHIITEVNGNELKIFNKRDNWNWGDWFGNHKKIAVYVSIKDVNSISLSGSGDVFFKEGLSASSLRLRITGSGDILGKVDVKTLESSVSGSGDLKISGRADNSTVSVVGSGNFTGRNLVTITTAVRVTGSGDADVNASERVDASVRGSGDVRYTGGAKNVSSSKTGSGDITRF